MAKKGIPMIQKKYGEVRRGTECGGASFLWIPLGNLLQVHFFATFSSSNVYSCPLLLYLFIPALFSIFNSS
jgi:hypothetical protein